MVPARTWDAAHVVPSVLELLRVRDWSPPTRCVRRGGLPWKNLRVRTLTHRQSPLASAPCARSTHGNAVGALLRHDDRRDLDGRAYASLASWHRIDRR